MRVGLDAHMIGQQETGNETYVLGLLKGFEEIGFALDAYTIGHVPLVFHRQHHLWPRSSFLRVPITNPYVAARDALDLFHAPAYVLPPFLPCPAVVTVQDISFALHPEWFPRRISLMLKIMVPASIRKARVVIVATQSEKRNLAEYYGVSQDKIGVTHYAPRPAYLKRRESVQMTNTHSSFLFVGSIEPRKNLQVLIKALDILRRRGLDSVLEVVGGSGQSMREIQRLVEERDLTQAVRFRGYLPDEDVARLYASCTALVHPALYEGFGLTILEAMAQGAPVLASNRPSIPEVAGDAAVLLDPLDEKAWAEAMLQVATDPQLRASMQERGLGRSSQFSWRKCAQQTLQVYESALS